MKIAKRPSYPRVPHRHTCRICPRRHVWECNNEKCDWVVLKKCVVLADQPGGH